MSRDPTFFFVIPCFNEQDNVGATVGSGARTERLRASRRCCLQLAALVLLGRKRAARYVETGHLNAHNHCDRLFAQTRVGLLTVPANQNLKGSIRCRITYDSEALNGHLELFLWA